MLLPFWIEIKQENNEFLTDHISKIFHGTQPPVVCHFARIYKHPKSHRHDSPRIKSQRKATTWSNKWTFKKQYIYIYTLDVTWYTLSPIIMEVENGHIWKVTTIGGTHFLTSMIMGGSVHGLNDASYKCSFWGNTEVQIIPKALFDLRCMDAICISDQAHGLHPFFRCIANHLPSGKLT